MSAGSPISKSPPNINVAGILSASDIVVAAPVGDGTLVSGASTAGSVVYTIIPDGFVSWTMLLKNYASGSIYTEVSNNTTTGTDGDWVEIKASRAGTTAGVELITYAMVANGYYRGNLGGFKALRARLIGGTGVTIQFTISSGEGNTNYSLPPGNSVIGKVGIDATTPGTTNKVAVSDSLGVNLNSAGPGFLRTTDEPTQLFYDSFDTTLDTVNYWTSTQGSGGVAATVVTGTMTLGTGTTANGFSKLNSIPNFKNVVPGWIVLSDAISLPDGAAPIANSYRYWGSGTTPATPTTTAPVTDGYGFELNTDGKLRAVVYAGGVRTVVQDLSSTGSSKQPLDALVHRYIIQVRTDKTFFYIDTIDLNGLVGTTNFQSPNVQTLPKLFLCLGGSTPPVSNTQFMCTGAAVSDTAKNSTQISDGTYPWRKALIAATGSVKVNVEQAGSALSVASIPVVIASDQFSTVTPLDYSPGLPVRQVPSDIFRYSFSDALANAVGPPLTLVATGSGQTVNQTNGNLVITAGTTANDQTLIYTVRNFRGQFVMREKTTLSQRIANNNFEIAIADLLGSALAYVINSATSVTVTFPVTNPFSSVNVGQSANFGALSSVGIPGRWPIASVSGLTITFTVVGFPASGSGTLTLWGWNYYRMLYTGTSATNANFDTQRKGYNTGDSVININSTASPGHMAQLMGNSNLVVISDALTASTSVGQFLQRGSRLENIADDDQNLYLFINCMNGATAPASSTTWNVGYIGVEQTGSNKVYVAGAEQSGGSYAVPTNIQASANPDQTGFFDLSIVGAPNQTLYNQNVLLPVSGTGWLDTAGYRSIYVSLTTGAGTVTSGQINFEGSNDQINFVGVNLIDANNLTSTGISFTVGPSITRYFMGPCAYRYFRLRINTGILGTVSGIQAFTELRAQPFMSPFLLTSILFALPTGANVIGSIANVASMTPVAPTTSAVASAATTNATLVKASSARVWQITATNIGTSVAFLKLFNKATAPVPGTDVPALTFSVPANAVPLVVPFGETGMTFVTGLGFSITNLIADLDTTVVVANQIKLNLSYT